MRVGAEVRVGAGDMEEDDRALVEHARGPKLKYCPLNGQTNKTKNRAAWEMLLMQQEAI